jgi:uncharacterized protein YaiL (DUF2058 family)
VGIADEEKTGEKTRNKTKDRKAQVKQCIKVNIIRISNSSMAIVGKVRK